MKTGRFSKHSLLISMNDICSASLMRRYVKRVRFVLKTRAEARAYARLPLTRHSLSSRPKTVAVAEKLGRKWITSDLGKFGIHTTRKRLIQVRRDLKTAGSFVGSAPASGAVSGALAGNLARTTTTDSELPNESSLTPAPASARSRMPARETRALPDSFFHGKTGGRLVVVGPINLPVGRLFVEEVTMECRKREATRMWGEPQSCQSRS